MNKTISIGAIGLLGLVLGGGLILKEFAMTDLATNQNCQVYSEQEFLEATLVWSELRMAAPATGITLLLTLTGEIPGAGPSELHITFGTSANPDELEYKGPFRENLALTLNVDPQDLPYPVSPMIKMIYPEKRAVCNWYTEQGFDLTDQSAPLHMELSLRSTKDVENFTSLDMRQIE